MKVLQCIVTLTVITGLLEEVHTFVKFKPPRLYPDTEEIIISSGETINLRCEGNRPINWSIPKYNVEFNEEELVHLSINFTKRLDSEYSFVSHLEVRDTYFLDTGYYYCHFQETNDMDAVEDVAKVYVYVNDTKDLLVHNSSLGFVMYLQYDTAIIPCKPTSPDVDVELYKDGELIDLNDSGFSYNPKEGFAIRYPVVSTSGTYTCIAKRGNHTEKKDITLLIHSQTDKVAKPKIEEKGFRHVVLGMNVRLECTVQVEIGIVFNMEWKTPNPSGLESGRVLMGNATSSKVTLNTIEYRVGSRDLIINNVTHDDEGYYECVVTDHSHNTNSDKKFLIVFEADTYYINFTVQGSKDIVANAGDDKAQWVVTVAAHPAPQLIWYNPHGKEITTSSSKYEVKTESTSAVLKISNIVVSDNGTYQLKGFNNGVETTENLTLTVHDKPAVEIDELSNKMFYMHNQKHKIKCNVVGYPTPNITWYFRSCGKSYPSCDDHETVFEKKYYEEFVLEDRGSKSSTLEIEALDSGYLTCFACNEVGCENETVNFFVTDIENGFNAEVLPAVPIEEDNVRLSCGASVFNYTNWITWKKYVPEKNDYVLIDNSSGYKVVKSHTDYSYRVDVLINNITKDYAGLYYCNVHKIEGLNDDDTVAVTVEVLGIRKPFFLDSNMNGSDYHVSASNGAAFICNATGVPTPDIRWFKDGERYDVPRDNKTIKFSEDRKILWIKYVTVEDEGKYTCKATNKAGVIVGSRILGLTDKRIGSLGLWIGLALGTTFFCLIIVYLIWNNRKEQRLRKELMYAGIGNFEEGALESINPELGVDDQAELLPYDKKWEFPREKLKLGKQLGSGAFGVVMKASAYGIVEGEALTTVAVKMVKRNAEYTHIKALASELKIMVHLGKHLNVVNLLGACTKNLTKRELLVIVEYCRFGNLQNYLLRHREDFINQIDPVTGRVDPLRVHDMECATSMYKGQEAGKSDPRANSQESQGSVQDYRAAPVVKMENTTCSSGRQMLQSDMTFDSTLPSGDEFGVTGGSCSGPEWRTNYRGDYGRRDVRPICTSDLICWAFQVARGIDYLASRKVLHGDLAARNILLAEDNIVKICDFGLAKSMYKSDNYKKKGDGPLPVKWMAIESIRDRVFSTQSDVWSFGIVLWEFFSLARTPYPGMEADERLYNKLVAGYRMEKPQYATDEVYSTMLDCWKAKPIDRPTFAELTDTLGAMLEDTVKRHYIDLNSPYITMNDQQRENTDYLGMMSEPSYANAIRGGTPQRDYVNAPCNPRDSPTQYLTMASPTPTIEEGDEPGYLCMQGGSPGSGVTPSVIFSPRPHPPLSFTFDVPSPRAPSKLSPRIRPVETKGAEGPELSPMLPDVCRAKNDIPTQGSNPPLPTLHKEDSVDSGMGSPNSYFNPTYRSLHKTNGHMPPSMEVNESGYINIPQSKEVSTKARESDRSSGFQSEVEEGSPVAIKNSPSYQVPPQIAT